MMKTNRTILNEAVLVIDKHTADGQKTHWDLMIETAEAMMTFRMDYSPENIKSSNCIVNIFDHDKRFLDYQGPVNNGRGKVEMVEKAGYKKIADLDNGWVMDISGKILKGRFELKQVNGENWRFDRID